MVNEALKDPYASCNLTLQNFDEPGGFQFRKARKYDPPFIHKSINMRLNMAPHTPYPSSESRPCKPNYLTPSSSSFPQSLLGNHAGPAGPASIPQTVKPQHTTLSQVSTVECKDKQELI